MGVIKDKLYNQNRISTLPHFGMRIVKTALAVFLCLLIYMLRGYRGLVSQSAVAAIICMQPYKSDSKKTGFNRLAGTLIGAGWGLLFLLLMQIDLLNCHMIVVYSVMAIGIALTLYSTVLMKKTASSSLAAIVFICIVVGYPNLEAPVTQTFNRIVDTCIGIVVATLVNSFELPTEKHSEYIFFINLQDLVPDRFARISSSVYVYLNRLVSDGAKICLISKWAPAFLLSQMGTVNFEIPVIVMDGAGLYDMKTGSYNNVKPIPQDKVKFLCDIFDNMGICYAIYSVRNSRTMVIYVRGKKNWAEQREYDLMQRSPYRNYLDGDLMSEDQVTFIRVVDSDVHMMTLEPMLKKIIPSEYFRVVRRKQPKIEGYSGIYFYNPEARVKNQENYLLQKFDKKAIEMRPKWDNYTPERDAIHLLLAIKKIYNPNIVDICLKKHRKNNNIF